MDYEALRKIPGTIPKPEPKRRKPLGENSTLARGKRLNPVNRERRDRRYAETFGDHSDWIRMLPCCICATELYERESFPVFLLDLYEAGAPPISDPAHALGRGAGGKAQHLVPMCRQHHRQSEDVGWGYATFCEHYGVDLEKIAELLWEMSPAKE